MIGEIPTLYFNVFDSYILYALRLTTIETFEPELKIISYKYHYKYKLILNSILGDKKLNETLDNIKETYPHIL